MELRNRHSLFGETVEKDIEGGSQALIERARLSVIEKGLFDACVASRTDINAAKKAVDGQMGFMVPAQLKITQLHSILWRFSQRVAKGDKVM